MDRDREQRATFEKYLRRPGRRRLARVIDLFHGAVWGMALRASGNEEDAHDIVQEVFLSLLLHPPEPGSIRSPRGYLAYRVLTFALRTQRSRERRRSREVKVARDVVRESIPDAPPGDEEALREAVTSLPDRVRQAIQLRYFLGLKNEEVASALCVSERTVEDDLREGRELLRKRLAPRVLGALALLATDTSLPCPPYGLRGELLAIARSGSALAPERVGTTWIGAVTAAHKWIAVACLAVLLAGAAWLALGPDASSPASKQVASRAADFVPPPPKVEEAAHGESSQPDEKVAAVEREDLVEASGWVMDEAGVPVPGARVSALSSPVNLYSTSHRTELLAEGTTDHEGRFRLDARPAGPGCRITLAAEKDGYASGWTMPDGGAGKWERPLARNLITLSSRSERIQGRVIDSSGSPVPGLVVRASVKTGSFGEVFFMDAAPRSVRTDAAGRFILGGLPAGSPIDLLFDGPEHLPLRLRHIVAGSPELEVRVEEGWSFAGSVVDTEGKPVSGALVSLGQTYDREPTWPLVWRSEKSSEDGAFRLLGVPEGPCSLEVAPPDRYLPVEPRMLDMDAPVEGFRIVLRAESWIRGTARERGSRRVLEGAGITVRARGMLRRVSSGKDGSFTSAVPPGEVEVLPIIGGGGDGGFRGRVEPGATVEGLEIWLQPEEPARSKETFLEGKTVDLEGRPVMALVGFSPDVGRASFGHTRLEAVAGPEGAFRLGSVRLPGHLIACSPAKRLRGEVLVEELGEVVLELEPYDPVRLEGMVLTPSRESPDGVPVAGAGILVSRTVEGRQAPVGCVLSERDGSFLIEDLVPDTPYLLNAQVGTVHGACATVIPRPGKTVQTTVWLPVPRAVLEGTLADVDGAPLSGIDVSWDFKDDEAVRYGRVRTDPAGRFRIQDICPGEYHLIVNEPGFAFWGGGVSTKASPVEIILQRTRMVLFELVDHAGLPHDHAPVAALEAESSTWKAFPANGSADGRFAVEVPLVATRIRIGSGQSPIEVELGGPSMRDIDLGRIVLDQP